MKAGAPVLILQLEITHIRKINAIVCNIIVTLRYYCLHRLQSVTAVITFEPLQLTAQKTLHDTYFQGAHHVCTSRNFAS